MRLKTIKLAGFKSFVDPTSVNLPGNMCAVVGPNGCGKSNIIDAVRWVMGESSAKHLRGESMADVIFNGSVGRAPVSHASIELVFDNSDMTLGGEFAKFSDIAVKRKVTRDGQSLYYLNGNKCRRKDITDLFLGTGLGPRSYAIIEQGMISRLIESRPEELRVFIEEAAGISKYKERRKETEQRIRRTRENLERLADIREELDRQLSSLQRQAKTAEKYRSYKQEERQLKARLSVVRWRHHEQDKVTAQEALQKQQNELEDALSLRAGNESKLDVLRQARSDQAGAVDAAQGDYYRVGAEIASLEQQIKGADERRRQLSAERQQIEARQQLLEDEIRQEQETLSELEADLEDARPELEMLGLAEEEAQEALDGVEEEWSSWQEQQARFAAETAEARRTAEVSQERIQQSERSSRLASEQIQRLGSELQSMPQGDDTETLLLKESEAELTLVMEERAEQRDALEQAQKQRELALETATQEVQNLQEKRQKILGQQGALEALEAAADDDSSAGILQFFEHSNLSVPPLLAEKVTAAPHWMQAVEACLGDWLGAYVIDNGLDSLSVKDWPAGLRVVEGQSSGTGLSMDVSGPAALTGWLSGALPLESAEEAMKRRKELQPEQFFLLPSGTRIGADWLHKPSAAGSEGGRLQRQSKLRELKETLSTVDAELETQLAGRSALREQQEQGQQMLRDLRGELENLNRELMASRAKTSAHEARQEQYAKRRAAILEEQRQLEERLQDEKRALTETRSAWDRAMAALENLAGQEKEVESARAGLTQKREQLRDRLRQAREKRHQVQMQLHTFEARHEGLQQSLDKSLASREQARERLLWVQEESESLDEPLEAARIDLEDKLAARVSEEEKLAGVRQALQQTDETLRRMETERLQVEESVQSIRGRIEEHRLAIREAELRQQSALEHLREAQTTLSEAGEWVSEEDSQQNLDQALENISARIQRLGAINLAAIDEYESQSERKVYLDEQNADLEEALETLETAIRKIDRETRQKFKETYDRVNNSLQALFPKVFGGGSANLELTGEDLLETGVAIMARPPGKKNSTIHLLSGGEKALTAIALVFSIFQLNPAPFCMLDEVDAPLDDANVGRYARMVKEMSSQVQFIYITHNKIAMEMADHLMGVTMHEPGVSRMVSVDVDEAAALANA